MLSLFRLSQIAGIQSLVDDAVSKGARLLAGGLTKSGEEVFFPPTLLVDVTPSMLIAQHEVSGWSIAMFS